MNKAIRNLDLEKILFFDIETVRRNKVLDVDSKEFELYAWSLRDKATGFIPPSIEVMRHYENNGALSPVFNKIVVISVGFIQDKILYYKSIVGTQKEVIEEFYKVVASSGFRVCGHNIIGFDLPVIRIKALEEGVDLNLIPEDINDSGKRPWNLTKVLDTMDISKGTLYSNLSLDALCMLKGINSSKDDISGAYVSQVYYSEGVERVAKYCNKDVIATAEVLCALIGKSDYIKEYVCREEKTLKEKTDVNIFEHILASGQLNPEIIKVICEKVEKEGIDKEATLKLVKTALSNSKLYNKVEEEDYSELKTALGLDVDYSLIQEVVNKGNLGKKQADQLIIKYIKEGQEIRLKVIELTEKFLYEKEKMGQKVAQKSFALLKEKLS